MSKRSVFTTVTPLPSGITRTTVLDLFHNHVAMIDLNPLVIERHPIEPPQHSSPEELSCIWYSLTDRIHYLPGGIADGQIDYTACFHDLKAGLQTHVFAPMGVEIKNKWTLGGNMPGEPRDVAELGLGVPKDGLWIREDVDLRCNVLMTGFVKKTLKKAHASLVARLVENAHIAEKDNVSRSTSTPNTIEGSGGISMNSSASGSGSGSGFGSARPVAPAAEQPQKNTSYYNPSAIPATRRVEPHHNNSSPHVPTVAKTNPSRVPTTLKPGAADRRARSSPAPVWRQPHMGYPDTQENRWSPPQGFHQHRQRVQQRQQYRPYESPAQELYSELPADETFPSSQPSAQSRIPNQTFEMPG